MTVVYTIMSAETLPAANNQSKPGSRPHRSPPRNEEGEIVCMHDECRSEQLTFRRPCEFNKHMDKHERPYKCNNPACRKSPGFTYAGGLLRHQREVHSMHRTKEPFFCPHKSCNRSSGTGFSRQENLQEHLRRRHSGDGVVGVGIGINTNDASTGSPTTTADSEPMRLPPSFNLRPPQPLGPLPISRKRRAATEGGTDDDFDRSSDTTTLVDEGQLRARVAVLQQENEHIRGELFRRDQRLTELLQENENLRGTLASRLPSLPHPPALSPQHHTMQTMQTHAAYHRPSNTS